ncbi:MAG: helicase, partial [Mesorhizobium sp.]
ADTAGSPSEQEEPKPILLWRQARFDHQRPRHRHHDNRSRTGKAAREGQADAASGQPGNRSGQEGRRDQRDGAGKPRFDRSKFKPRPERETGERREGRPQGERPERREARPDWKGNRQDAKENAAGKPSFQGKPREERPQRFDPDSPFAKLAALRDQLKK